MEERKHTIFGRQVTLFELLGFKVKVDASWLLLALLITWTLAQGYFPSSYGGLAAATYWGMGIVSMIGILLSLVFHELSHSIVARHYGLRIEGITLFLFGGVAEMEEEPPNPKTEMLMAIAGPIASMLLAVLFYGLSFWGEGAGLSAPITGVARYLGFLNGILAIFNMVPAFPLDGGRVLRAAFWGWKGNLREATRISTRLGSAFGFVLIALGVLNVLTGNFVGGMWWFLIGLFIRGAAASSYYQVMTRQALAGIPVSRFMSPQPVTVPPDITVRELVEDYVYKHYYDIFPVTRDSLLLGCVTTRQVKEVPRDRWGLVTVGAIATSCSEENTVEADEDAMRALLLMQRTGNSRLMVTKNGRLVGIVSLKDMLNLLALKSDLEELE